MIALAALLAAAVPCTGPVCNFDTLAPYLAKFGHAREVPVHVLQIGDSHTAGDVLTRSWRELLQAQGGNGGRGVLAPGRPYDGYFTQGVTVSMSPGWSIAAAFGNGSAAPRPPLGLSGFTLTSSLSGASMRLTAVPEMAFDRFVLCALAGPGMGAVTIRLGKEVRALYLDGFAPGSHCETVHAAQPQTIAEVAALAGSVTLTSWATFSDEGGVALSNVGIVGSQLQHFARTDDGVLAEELRAYSPDLIVLAFGTNEGFGPRIDVAAYEGVLRAQIGRLRTLAADAPILLLGPPDALSRREELRGGAADCPAIPGVAPLFAPPGLAQVRAVQRRVAADLHVAWWDWQARMGGRCSAQRWVNQDPPLMRGDYVHFRAAGGKALARLLQDDLDHAAGEP